MKQASAGRRFLRAAVRKVAYPIVGLVALAFRLYRRKDAGALASPPDRILVIRLDLLGDVLLTMPTVEALRTAYPLSRIVMLTLPYTAPLARLFDCADEVVALDTNRIRRLGGLLSPRTWIEYVGISRRIRAERFDLCLSVSGRMASLCSVLSGASTVVGYAGEAYPFTLTHPVPGARYSQGRHEVEACAQLAARAGVDVSCLRLELPVGEGSKARIHMWLRERGVESDDRLVVIHAGSINGTAKRWPPAYWAQLAGRLRRGLGAHIVLVGAASDRALSDAVSQMAEVPLLSAVGETSVEELAALLQRADLVATGDSGPLHLAVALERPLLCVYGPTDPRIYGPFRPRAPVRLLRVDLPCSPCYTAHAVADCPFGDPICMRLVTVSEMNRAAMDLSSAILSPVDMAGDTCNHAGAVASFDRES